MFDYNPQLEEDITYPEEQYVTEVTPGAGEFDKLDPTQLLHTAITKDLNLKDTLKNVESAEKIKDEEKRMIEAVKDKIVKPKQKGKTEDLNKEAEELLLEAEKKTEEGMDAEEAAKETLVEQGLVPAKDDDESSGSDGPEIQRAKKSEEGDDEKDSNERSEDDEKEDKTLGLLFE